MEEPKSTKKTDSSVNIENGPASAGNDATDLEALDYFKGSSDPDSPSHTILRELYQSYLMKQRRPGLVCFLFASILFDLWVIAVPQGQSIVAFGITVTVLVINLCILLFIRVAAEGRLISMAWKYIPAISWILAIAQISLYSFLETFITTRDILGWWILLCFLVIVTIPIPDVLSAIFYTANFFIIMFFVLVATIREVFFFDQILAMTSLTAPAALIGVWAYGFWHCKQKRAFLEAKKSLEVKMVMEEQSAEQERLLLSVLPEHVAVKMRQDLGSTNSEQFKKIYMSRHENVSILYADIVGFTAISSTYSAQDLVKMLNELFARFDRLAEKYQQLRIKILGDCYYCISGAPVERPDHAVLCVHMGLSMVKAIKYVQQKTNSPVDMRVGIHTGAILAGILGQRQWQFDVYSRDVVLANKMESSGKAGRVHISDMTLSFLTGEFEVEPAYGEKREEALRAAGLKTYFITKVLVPFVSPVNAEKNGSANANHTTDTTPPPADESPTEVVPDEDSKANSQDDDATATKMKAADDFKHRLRKELISRDGHRDLHKDTNVFLKFKNAELEAAYSSHREPYSSCPLLAFLMIEFFNALYSSQILPRILIHYVLIVIPSALISILVITSVAESFTFSPPILIKISKKFNDTLCLRRIAAILIILFCGGFHLLDVYNYSRMPAINPNITSNLTSNGSLTSHKLLEQLILPSFLTNFSVLILISVAVVAQLSHVCKIFFMVVIAGLQFAINIQFLGNHFEFEEQLMLVGLPTRYNVSSMLFVVTLALSFLSRYMDKEDRVIFKWKTEVAEQKEKVSDLRRRNEALVYNVLPVHVAEHFMKNKKRSHDDLYSQSYAEVGVLFASMPNFSDFYSEETVNNQGLECLRFLNEVISDYDALLELPQFQDIIKIKTIGSTYMAASGLNLSRQVKPDDPMIIRWAHLALLVEFALELKKALHGINEQSFNHFVLKMGINHGPITAGVIGARKPHYDIWGNTVNVASRMESTGKAGAIQVTEETCQILQTFGYTFEQRGLVTVKGKGQLMTYYLQGKIVRPAAPASPNILSINMMEPLPEVEEPCDSPKLNQTTTTTAATDNTTSALSSTTNPTELPLSSSCGTRTNSSLPIDSNDISLQEKMHGRSDSRTFSSKNNKNNNAITADMLALSSTLDRSFEKVEQLTSSSASAVAEDSVNRHHNGLTSSDVDLDVDAKTPLLNMNSTNIDCREYNGSEMESLIKAQ